MAKAREETRRTQNRIIYVGVIAAVLTQYAWLLPLAQAYTVFIVVAMSCALVVGVWKIIEYCQGARL